MEHVKEILSKVKAEIVQNFNTYDFNDIDNVDESLKYVREVQDILKNIPKEHRPKIEKVIICKNAINIIFNKESIKTYNELFMTKWNNITITNKNDRINMIF